MKHRNYKIRIISPEHSEKVQKHLFSLGFTWAFGIIDVSNREAPFLTFDSNSKRIYIFPPSVNYEIFDNLPNTEVELIEKIVYDFQEIPKRKVVKVGEFSYYEDELEIALENIKPI